MQRHKALFLPSLLLVLACAPPVLAQQATFKDVKVRYPRPKDRLMVENGADLILDDVARRLVVKSKDRPLTVSYDDIDKVILEADIRGTDPTKALAFGGLVGGALYDERRAGQWLYLEYRQPDGSTQPFLLRIGRDAAAQVREKVEESFGDKVAVRAFREKPEPIEKKTLKEYDADFETDADKKNHPLPELRSDKALVVVVCLPINTRYAGKGKIKVHANNQVVAVTPMGTYAFVYLDPGEYALVSQAGDAYAIRINLEAGQDYYFLQSGVMGWTSMETTFSRQSKELVMYELNGAWHATWSRKK